MTTAIVTGGAGFIGLAVARHLREAGNDVQIAGTSSVSDPLTAERIAALPSFDLVVHCAGGSSVAASVQDPRSDFEKTVPPLRALLERVRTRDPHARVVLLSSAAVYGEAPVPTPETAPIAPVSPYGRHKQQCEELCRDYGERHGVASAIVRLFSVYGAGLRKQLLWDASHKARAGEPVFAGTGEEQRDWLHVDDAAALVRTAAEHASPRATPFNGASGIGVRVRDVVEQICRELGAPSPRFTGTARTGDPSRYVADIARARALGWAPRVELSRGISEYVAWFVEQQ